MLEIVDYWQSGLLQKVVHSFPMWTVGLTRVNSIDNRQTQLEDFLNQVNALQSIKRAAISARLFGTAWLVLCEGADIEPVFDEPIGAGQVEYLLLKEIGELIPVKDELQRVTHFIANNKDKTVIHRDRVLEFTGAWSSPAMGGENMSVLKPIEAAYNLHYRSNGNISRIIERFLTFVQKVGNLKAYLSTDNFNGSDYTDKLQEALRWLVNTIGKGVLLMDKANGEIDTLSPNVSGLGELSKTILENLVANTDIPYSLLMGSGNYAMSSEVEYKFFRVRLSSYFGEEIEPAVRKLCTVQGYQVKVTIDFES